jgi:ADP-ribose pyrophosphatase YjhB (NUDIX family)
MINYNFCNNCGKNGHIFHQCKKPIISLGIILFRFNNKKIEYLMICRKDSLGYIDFLRGKYPIQNKTYIMNLINEMTQEEKNNLLTSNFNDLWNRLWGNRIGLQYKNEEKTSKDKFYTLLNGNDLSYNLKSLILESKYNWEEPEWGFPKGRRNQSEKDIIAAKREFEEETGINSNKINIIDNLMPLEEIFMGSNLKSYIHKYYLANINNKTFINLNNFQKTEVSAIKWLTFKDCLKYIRKYNYEKIQLIKSVDKILHKYSLIL